MIDVADSGVCRDLEHWSATAVGTVDHQVESSLQYVHTRVIKIFFFLVFEHSVMFT